MVQGPHITHCAYTCYPSHNLDRYAQGISKDAQATKLRRLFGRLKLLKFLNVFFRRQLSCGPQLRQLLRIHNHGLRLLSRTD